VLLGVSLTKHSGRQQFISFNFLLPCCLAAMILIQLKDLSSLVITAPEWIFLCSHGS
jgi:hypothetical protein